MKKVLYAAALLFLVTACTPKPESKPSPVSAIVAVIYT